MSSNYLLGLQIFGKGTPTSDHTATIYSPDKDGIQSPYAADQPVWRGSRANRYVGYFNGTDTNVLLVPSLFPGNTFDISFKWRRDLTDALVSTRQDIIRLSVSGAPYFSWAVYLTDGVDSAPRALLYQSDGSFVYTPAHAVGMPVGETWDFRFWSDGTNINLSLNGVVTSRAYDGTVFPTDGNSAFVVGGQANRAGGAIHDFVVDGVSIPFNEGSGAIVSDSTGTKAGDITDPSGTFWSNVIRNDNNEDFADDDSGVLLDPPPQLVSQPLAENLLFSSNDLSGWSDTAPVTLGQPGIDGQLSASLIEDNSDTAILRRYRQRSVGSPSAGTPSACVYYVRKETSINGSAELYITQFGGTAVYNSISFNAVTGAHIIASGTLDVTIIDSGKFWKIILSSLWIDAGNTTIQAMIRPVAFNTDTTTQNVALQGSLVVGNVEAYIEKSVEQVVNSGAIFTTNTAVATDAVNPEFDVANLDNDAMALGLKVRPDGAGLLVGNFLNFTTGNKFTVTDKGSNAASLPGNVGAVNDVGIVVHKDEGKMALYVNGTWSADVAYSGELHNGKFDLGRLNEFPAGYYDIRVTKGGTFDELKLKTTNALSTQAGSVNSNPGFSPGFNNGFH